MSKKFEQIFDFLKISENLKNTHRWKATKQMKVKESSADHSWHMTLLSFIVAAELDLKVDLLRSLKIALVHDLVEALTDDVDSVLVSHGIVSADTKKSNEEAAISQIISVLPAAENKMVSDLWHEYENRVTQEAQFIVAMDKIEGIHHMVYMGHESFHFADIVGTYPNKAVTAFPDLLPVLKEHQKRLKPKFKKHGWEWQKEFEIDGLKKTKIDQNIKKIFDFIQISEKLKETKRWLNTKEMIWKESSADHSWNLALLSFLVSDALKLKVDVLKSIKLALVHDLVEALVGDTDYSLIAWGIKTPKQKHDEELKAIHKIRETLPEKSGYEIERIWNEYDEAKTAEARFIKALDKIEGINHMLCIGYTCFDHPELIAPYPRKAVLNYPELIPIYQELLKRLKPEFAKKGWEWKKEYNI